MRQWVELLPKESIDERDSEGFTALHYAARFNKFNIVQLLLDSGAGGLYKKLYWRAIYYLALP